MEYMTKVESWSISIDRSYRPESWSIDIYIYTYTHIRRTLSLRPLIEFGQFDWIPIDFSLLVSSVRYVNNRKIDIGIEDFIDQEMNGGWVKRMFREGEIGLDDIVKI